MSIKVCEVFSETPGGRYITDGDFSAEEFRLKILAPVISECILFKDKVTIDLDGTYGYSSGFLEESFGGLVRMNYPYNEILNCIEFISREDKLLPNRIKKYILEEGKRQLKEKGEKIL